MYFKSFQAFLAKVFFNLPSFDKKGMGGGGEVWFDEFNLKKIVIINFDQLELR